jgi:serine/threonine protein kinase
MTTTSPSADLLERIRKSGLVSIGDLQPYLHSGAQNPRELLTALVHQGLLTEFQSERLAAGKYKGFLLGSYKILGRLGQGGMGQVYLAEHAAMRRFVALKVLPASVTENDVAKERFLREARAAATLDHPNIVRVFDLNREGKVLYLVMEYVEGTSLQNLVDKGGRLPVGAAVDYVRQIAEGLQHAHERGLVHRDIKPANLLVDRAGTARILDLGLVRSETDEDSKLTAQLGGRSILGTADYLAPEQAVDSSSVDIRADLYSLGATLYFLLAGHPIFPEGRAGQKLMWQQWREPTPICEIRPDVPVELARVIQRAIAKNREDRFPDPREFAEALEPYAEGPAVPDQSLIVPPPPRPFAPRLSQRSNDAARKGNSPAAIRSSRRLPTNERSKDTIALETADTESGPVYVPPGEFIESTEPAFAKPRGRSRAPLLIVAFLCGIGVAFLFLLLVLFLTWSGLLKT